MSRTFLWSRKNPRRKSALDSLYLMFSPLRTIVSTTFVAATMSSLICSLTMAQSSPATSSSSAPQDTRSVEEKIPSDQSNRAKALGRDNPFAKSSPTETSAGVASSPSKAVKPLVAKGQIKPAQLGPSQTADLYIELSLTKTFKAYADQFKLSVVSPEGFKVGQIRISPLTEFFDKPTKQMRKGLQTAGEIKAIIEAPENVDPTLREIEIQLAYQACTDTYCLFPETLTLKIPFQFIPATKSQNATPTDSTSGDLLKQAMDKGYAWTFLFVFVAGILTSFTPCIFPMIPITLTVLGRHAHTRSRAQNFFVSLMYVMGIAVTYSILGLVAASTGALFGHFMSHPIVLGVMCAIFLAMAFSMFGAFELEAPAFLRNRFATSEDLSGYSGAFISGLISGIVASPCVGPVLVGILTYIAKSQNLQLGFALMFIYALGMGQIFLVLGLFSQLTKKLPRSGAWLDGIKNIFGLMMLGVFFYFLGLLVPQRVWDGAIGAALVIYASYFGAFVHARTPGQRVRKGIYQACIILGAVFIAVGIFDLRPVLQPRFISEPAEGSFSGTHVQNNWIPYSDAELAKAAAEGRPVIVDFYADWCAACKEMDQFTFSEEKFKLMAQQFTLLKFDATQESPELDKLKEKYSIFGLPTMLFFDGKGAWMKDLTLTAFEGVDPFVGRMKAVLISK